MEFELAEADVIEGEEPLRGVGDDWLISNLGGNAGKKYFEHSGLGE